MPKRGEKVEVNGLRFKVIRADSRRVHLLEMVRKSIPAPAGDNKPA
jgi:magnesium and cobalt transporter